MKILLVYPYPLYDRSESHEEDISVVPIGLYYIGALLKRHHHDVQVLNWYNIHKNPKKIVETFLQNEPQVVGFSIINANRWAGVEIAQIAKKVNPKIKVIFGGVSPTFLWKHFLSHFPDIDFVVIGEGEYTFLNLVQVIEKGNYQDLKNIKGIAFRKGTKVVRTEDASFITDLDELPIPAEYFTYQHVVSSRGCSGKCTFCGSPRFWRHKIRFRSPENFVYELELLYKKGIRFFYFSDDAFTIDKKRVIKICRKILEKGLKVDWFAISRADYVDQDILYWMRKAGCIQISYGVESGSEKVRNLLGKHLKTGHIRKAFALTHRYGILARAYFIYGSPQETRETIQETIALIKEIKPLVCISYILEIYPGTKLYADFCKKSEVTDDIWLEKRESVCFFESDPDLSPELILAFGQKIRNEIYTNLHRFAESLDLIDRKEFYEMHADFCSRLGLTFTHGDYSNINAIKEKEKTAEQLFKKALDFAPNHRAYLGLGMLKQNERNFEKAVKVLSEGVKHFPESEQLGVCLGINHMNLGEYKEALANLLKFQDSKQTSYHIAGCYKALGNRRQEAAFLQKASRLEQNHKASWKIASEIASEIA